MKSQSAKALLENLEAEVERQLQQVIASYQNLPEGKLNRPRADGGWSITQCFSHLNSYCDYYFPRIEKGLSAGHAHNSMFTSTWLGSYFTRIIKPGAKMKKYKAIKLHEPPANLNGHNIVALFIENQEKLLAFLRQAQTSDLYKVRIPISILPWIKLRLGDVFQFLIAHQQRHLLQAERIL